MWAARVTGDLRDGWGFVVEGDPNKSGYTSICTPGSAARADDDARAVGHDRAGGGGRAGGALGGATASSIDERIAAYWQVPSPYPGMADMLDIVRANPEASRLYLRDGRPPRAGDVDPQSRPGAGAAADRRCRTGRVLRGRDRTTDRSRPRANWRRFVTADDLARARVDDREPVVGSLPRLPDRDRARAALRPAAARAAQHPRGLGPARARPQLGGVHPAGRGGDEGDVRGPGRVPRRPVVRAGSRRTGWSRRSAPRGGATGSRPAGRSSAEPVPAEAPGTTHVSVVDGSGHLRLAHPLARRIVGRRHPGTRVHVQQLDVRLRPASGPRQLDRAGQGPDHRA